MSKTLILKDLVLKNRSYRRFYEDHKITLYTLRELTDLARLSPSGANLQPLRFFLSCQAETNSVIFPHLAWAAYLRDWAGPPEGERPSAYIIILGDSNSSRPFDQDAGIACQSILLGAVEKGLGGCIIAAVKRAPLARQLQLPGHLKISLVIALGRPKEKVILEALKNEDVKYWRDSDGTHHVPKRKLEDIILFPK